MRELRLKASSEPLLYQQDNSWVFELLSIEEEDDVSSILQVGESHPSTYDLENVKIIFERYKDIPVELAAEESFWTYLTHVNFWSYMTKRWPYKSSDKNINVIYNRFFFGKNQAKYRNGISRLWWYGFITYNELLKDPYHYTKIALRDQERASLLLESANLSRNQVALMAALDILNDLDEMVAEDFIEYIPNQRNKILRPLVKYINDLGGILIWDIFDQDEAKSKMEKFIDELIEDKVIMFKSDKKGPVLTV